VTCDVTCRPVAECWSRWSSSVSFSSDGAAVRPESPSNKPHTAHHLKKKDKRTKGDCSMSIQFNSVVLIVVLFYSILVLCSVSCSVLVLLITMVVPCMVFGKPVSE
jgi:hypothetical protein